MKKKIGNFFLENFLSLVHRSDMILHIMIVLNGLHDLAIVSSMFRIINYA